MKNLLALATTFTIGLGLLPAFAQPGPRMGGPHFGGSFGKLFGDNQAYSAAIEIQTGASGGHEITMPGKISFDTGKARFEMDMSQMKGGSIPPSSMQQMKAMGMSSMVSISRPDLKVNYIVYPGLNSYVEMASEEESASLKPDDYKIESTMTGKETVDGHDCVINQATVTDKDGSKHEFTVWNASDLKKFPVKIMTNENGRGATMHFKDMVFEKPAAAMFDPPAGFTKYDSVQAMMQAAMMSKMGGAGGPPH